MLFKGALELPSKKFLESRDFFVVDAEKDCVHKIQND
jgi:hypothetical protein